MRSPLWRGFLFVTLFCTSSPFVSWTTVAATEPTLVAYQESNWTDALGGAETTPSITWQAGDVIVVIGVTLTGAGGASDHATTKRPSGGCVISTESPYVPAAPGG